MTGQSSEAVIAEDQRPDAVVGRARDPGAIRRRRQHHEDRPGETDDQHRCSAGEQLARSGDAPTRRDPEPRERDARHDRERHEHLRFEAEPDTDSTEDQPARATVLERPDEEPQRRDAEEDEEGIGVVMARDGDRRRRGRKRQAGREARDAAEAPANEVVQEPDGQHAHQRLRDEQAQRMKAEDPGRQRLDPERQRRLVDSHQPGLVHRGK